MQQKEMDLHHIAAIMSQMFTLMCILLVIASDFQKLTVLAIFRPPDDGRGQADVDGKEPIPQNIQSVVTCTLGKPHRKFEECRCGEYAIVVPKSEIPPESLPEYHVKRVHRFKREKELFYFCSFCSMCPDGIRTSNNCTQTHDTQCSSGECIDPTHVFDIGRKACIKDPALESTTTIPTSIHADDGATKKSSTRPIIDTNLNDGNKLQEPQPITRDDLSWLWAAVAILSVSMIIVVIVNFKVCLYFRQQRLKNRDEARPVLSDSKETVSDV